jgi:hypothetical protein
LLGDIVERFPKPDGLTKVEVCAVSGLLPNEHCTDRVEALFIEGTEPTEYCNVHRAEQVNRETGKLATACTPPELVEERVYEIYPPEAADWVREQGIPQPPTQRDEIYGCGIEGGDVAILDPTLGGHVTGVVSVRGNARAGDFAFYRLEFGQGLNPSSWSQIGGDHYNQVDNNVLEYWDVMGLQDGLYTLKLSVVENSQNVQQSTLFLTVDNEPPVAAVSYPWPGRVYHLETDEWANLTADVSDNVQIDKVEFYLDDELLDFSVVEPYAIKWVLEMRDQKPDPNMAPVFETRPVTDAEGLAATKEVSVTWVQVSEDGETVTQTWDSGLMVVAYKKALTESHLVHVIAYDAAGNKTESEKVRFYVTHEPKEKKKKEQGSFPIWRGQPRTAILPVTVFPPASQRFSLEAADPSPPGTLTLLRPTGDLAISHVLPAVAKAMCPAQPGG